MVISSIIKSQRIFHPSDIMDGNTLGEWSDSDDEWIWDADESTLWEWSDPEADDIIRNVQTGGGEKRKCEGVPEPEQDFYVKESVKKTKSKKFRMTATDYTLRFNNVVSDLDLIESYQRTQEIFEHLLNDVIEGMNEKDQVRFVLRSTQLDTPISMPFMPVPQLTPERVFSQIERVIQSNRDFRLNDTVTVDIIHVEAPQGSGRSKRGVLNIKEYLHKKGSVITIQNNDNLCLARALVVAVAKIENAPDYKYLVRTDKRGQEKKARELHTAANVPLGPCGIPEVEMFQKYLTNYEINIVSGNHDNSIIIKIEMKRMVLIPEERLLRYEERDKQRTENRNGIMYGGGEDSEETQEDSLSVEMIVRGIPKSMKTRAEALLAHLKERGDVITWDDMGQVLLDGVLIPKSNISDLVSDAMRPRKHFNPVGVREFYNVLNKINVPKDLVRNERRWSEAEKKKVSLNEKNSPEGNYFQEEEPWVSKWITF